jgi:hypothetical protein
MSPPATTPTPPAAPTLPPEPPPRPAPGPLRNGNPRGNPNLAPRCGAKARTTGCPCRAPAMPNGRCRMHGGKCRGPATPEGRERMTAANTKHGNFSAYARAEKHHVRTFTSRNRLVCAATLLWPYLPPDMAARLAQGPAEFFAPIHPSNLPYLTPQDAMACNVKTRPGKPTSKPTGRAAERLAVRTEAAAQAPWRQAIALARAAKRAIRRARAAWRQKQSTTPSPLAGEGRGEGARRPGSANTFPRDQHTTPTNPATPAPPPATWQDLTLLQRELAARLAGLRGPRCGHPPNDAPPSPQAGPKSPGRNALQREPTVRPAARQTETAGRIAVQRENPTPPPPTRSAPSAARRTLRAEPPTPDPAPPAPLNRAARRRLKHLQRRRDRTARPRP